MTQNVISLALSADQLAEVNKALDALEKHLADLISLSGRLEKPLISAKLAP